MGGSFRCGQRTASGPSARRMAWRASRRPCRALASSFSGHSSPRSRSRVQPGSPHTASTASAASAPALGQVGRSGARSEHTESESPHPAPLVTLELIESCLADVPLARPDASRGTLRRCDDAAATPRRRARDGQFAPWCSSQRWGAGASGPKTRVQLSNEADMKKREHRGSWILMAGLLLTTSACGYGIDAATDTRRAHDAGGAVELYVTNHHNGPMEIYAAGSGTSYRIGTVYPGFAGHFVVRPGMIINGPVEFLARSDAGPVGPALARPRGRRGLRARDPSVEQRRHCATVGRRAKNEQRSLIPSEREGFCQGMDRARPTRSGSRCGSRCSTRQQL